VSWGSDDAPPAKPPAYPDLDTFVRDWLAPTYRRNLETGGRAWCASWQEHPEAVSRLTGLWRAYEHLHEQKGTALSVFWRDHADPCMDRLLDEQGPFSKCPRGHTDRLAPLPLALTGRGAPEETRGA